LAKAQLANEEIFEGKEKEEDTAQNKKTKTTPKSLGESKDMKAQIEKAVGDDKQPCPLYGLPFH
jgi:hypothetical protein